MKQIDLRNFSLKANKKAAVQAMIENARIDPIGTSFAGKGNLTMEGLEKCVEKTMAIYDKNPW